MRCGDLWSIHDSLVGGVDLFDGEDTEGRYERDGAQDSYENGGEAHRIGDVEKFVKFGCGLVEVDCGCGRGVSRQSIPCSHFRVMPKVHPDQSKGAHLVPTYKQRPCSVPFG